MVFFALITPIMLTAGNLKGKVLTKAEKQIPRRTAQRYPGKHNRPPGKLVPIPAVVVLMGPVKGFPLNKPTQPLIMEQKSFDFIPPLLVVPLGADVEFPNRDDDFHNVFSYSKLKRFDLGRYHKGESKTVTFTKPGIGKVYCEIHEWMRAAVVVVENPFYTTVDKDGNYEIKNIPAGTYKFLIWKMDHKQAVRSVTIPANGTVTRDFSLPQKKDENQAAGER